MIDKKTFSLEHIKVLEKESGAQIAIIERTMFAFGLLEAISQTGLPFIFKGGSCLMVLLKEPKRFSTDIDIIVPPGTNIDEYIAKAGKIFPFFHVEENFRARRNNIEKRHFKFLYISPLNENPVTVILDVLFEENHYSSVTKKVIGNKLLLTDGKDVEVSMPGINCILGDKLTAFAPHTTGIGINDKKELEIIKQMFDCATLLREINDFSEVKKTYKEIVKIELAYRELNIDYKEVLLDTIKSAAVIIGRGSLYKSDEIAVYSTGIRAIGSHLLSKKYDFAIAGFDAAQVMYLASSILSDSNDFSLIKNISDYNDCKIENKDFSSLSSLRKISLDTYAYIVEATKLL
jgi:predicted nucleotidyltransferase component of viral defense system